VGSSQSRYPGGSWLARKCLAGEEGFEPSIS
jgi:hypothetical protein